MRRKGISLALPAILLVGALMVGVVAFEGAWFSGRPDDTASSTQLQESGASSPSTTTSLGANSSSDPTVTVTVTVASTTETVTVTSTVTTTVYSSLASTQSTQSAQSGGIVVTDVLVPASDFSTTPGNTGFYCNSSGGPFAYFELTNYMPESTDIASVTILWAGQNSTFTNQNHQGFADNGSCSLGPAGTGGSVEYVDFNEAATIGAPAVTGQPFEGIVTFTDGYQAVFTALWQ